MKFIHIADVHLGAQPEGADIGKVERGNEIWNTLEKVLHICEEKQMDLLLVAGDMFHRQPLLRELKELNFLFSKLTKTKVVWIAGNHDYIKQDSYYKTFEWCENVYPILGKEIECLELPQIQTAIYGLSYYSKEITEAKYDEAYALGKQKYEILLAHGGDDSHIPIKKEKLVALGYDYVALGHIHKPQVLVPDKIVFAGALEPIDKNDTGQHGYVEGEITEDRFRARFRPFAKREYMHIEIRVDESVTNGELKERIREQIREKGIQNIYKFILKGFRDADIEFDTDTEKYVGNVIEIDDQTTPFYDFEMLLKKNKGNLLGRFIESMQGSEPGSVEYKALYEGVQALLLMKGK